MFKKKDVLTENVEQPKKSKKKLKVIIIVFALILVACLALFIIAGSGDDGKIPTIEDEMSEQLEFMYEQNEDGTTLRWYRIDLDDVSRVEDYVDLLRDKHNFNLAGIGDNEYYLYYNDAEGLEPLYIEANNREYHLRIMIADGNDKTTMVTVTYVDGLFDTAPSSNKADDKTDADSADNKNNGSSNNSAKDEVLVSELGSADSASGQKPGKDSVKFQSMYDYFSPDFTFSEISQSGLTYSQKFYATEDDEDVIAAYMDFMCSDGMNFKKASDYYQDYRGMHYNSSTKTVFASWGLSYTGTAEVEENCKTTFVDGDKMFAISVYYTIEYGKIEGVIYWSGSLDSCDLGFRPGGKVASTAPGGKSAATGLIRTADGKYKTTDGRFSADLNEVVLMMNGKTEKGVFEYNDNTPDCSDLLKINKSDNNKLFSIYFPYSGDQKTGTIYNYKALLQKYQYPMNDDPYWNEDAGTPIVYQYVGSEWLTATYKNSPCKDMTLRTVYYNETEQVAVYYVYTKFLEETEVFCVVDLSKAKKPDSQGSSDGGSGYVGANDSSLDIFDNKKEDKPCQWCRGKGSKTCISCNGKGYRQIIGSAPDYAGTGGKSYNVTKDCTACVGGYKDCPHCP